MDRQPPATSPDGWGTHGDQGRPNRCQPIPGDLLLHPLAVLALVVVILNDRVLKVRYPGMISGKLSDFAGLIYFPLFVATLTEVVRRVMTPARWDSTPRLTELVAVVTGVIFALAKVWTPWANAYRTVLGAIWWPLDAARSTVTGNGWPPLGRLRLVQDWTDLTALPALIVPVLIANQVAESRKAMTDAASQRAACQPRRPRRL